MKANLLNNAVQELPRGTDDSFQSTMEFEF